MEKLPVVPPSSPLSADDVRREIAGLRRFHLGDPAARGSGDPRLGLSPALLHGFGDSRAVRSGFPVHVAWASDPDQPLCRTVGELLGTALLKAVQTPDRARLIADNLIRAERVIRDRVDAAGGRLAVDGALADVAAQVAADLELAAPIAEQLGLQWAAVRAEVADGELLGLDRKTSLHLLLGAARSVVPARRRAFRDEVTFLRDKLNDLLDIERRKDPAATEADALRGAVGSAGATLLDPAALAKIVGTKARGSVRLDPRRRARIEQALEVLDEHVDEEPRPMLTVVHAAGREPGVVDRDLRLVEMVDPCVAAANLFDVEAERQAILFRAVRLARLEVEGAYEPDRHDLWLEALDWRGFTDEELLLVPTFVALETTADLVGERLGALSRLLCSGRPLHVLALATPLDTNPEDGELPVYRLELGYLGVSHREAFVQQATAARPAHLGTGFQIALSRPRTALHVVSTGLDADDHAPGIGAFLYAGAAIDSRAHPLFRYDPDAGATWARRLDFSGNPDVEDDWAGGPLRFVDASGAEVEADARFTFADFGLLDPALASEYRPIPPGVEDPALRPIADLLAVEVPDDDDVHALPFVQGVDAESRLVRVAITRRLMAAARDRLGFWHTLQELSGVRNEHVREAVARARDEAADAALAERESLIAQHGVELERARDAAVANAMDGLARSLLDLTPDALGAMAAAPAAQGQSLSGLRVTGSGVPAAARQGPGPGEGATDGTAAADVAETAAEAEAEPEADEAAFAEPWIDTPLCTSCNDCRNINGQLFVYDDNKQARIGDPAAGTFRQLVLAAEKCPARCIHPGVPLNQDEPGLEELVARAAPFNR